MGRDFLSRSRLPPHLDLVLFFFSSKKSFVFVFFYGLRQESSFVLSLQCFFLVVFFKASLNCKGFVAVLRYFWLDLTVRRV